jgi:FkbM family methyltransferase
MYSQQEEEKYILEAVAGIENGRLLDLGAWGPITFSNSRALIEKGWDAVLIEFSPKAVRDQLIEYGYNEKVTIVQAAMALEAGMIHPDVTDDAVSTDNPDNLATWKANPKTKFIGKMWVPTVTMDDIFNRFCGDKGGFDFVSIDTEGSSVDLALAFFKTEMFPKCYCIEHDKRTHDLLSVALSRGYQARYLNDTNIVLALP